MDLINCSCYHLFIDTGKQNKFVENKSSKQNFITFSKTALEKVTESISSQEFVFKPISLVKEEFLKYKDDANYWEAFCEILSSELISTQQQSQKTVSHLGKKVTPGSLLIIHCRPTGNDVDILFLIKMEQEEFAHVQDFSSLHGLPFEKKALNTAFITFKNNGDELQISRTSAFWINFLSAVPLRESRLNTTNAFKAIDNVLTRKVKNEGFKSDHIALRNHLLTYLRNHANEVVSYNEMIEVIFTKHKPHQSAFKPNEIATHLKSLALKEKSTFDSQFCIDMSDVKAKRRKIPIILNEGIELNLSDGVANLEETIKPFEEDGRKGIVIFSDEGYLHFQRDED